MKTLEFYFLISSCLCSDRETLRITVSGRRIWFGLSSPTVHRFPRPLRFHRILRIVFNKSRGFNPESRSTLLHDPQLEYILQSFARSWAHLITKESTGITLGMLNLKLAGEREMYVIKLYLWSRRLCLIFLIRIKGKLEDDV